MAQLRVTLIDAVNERRLGVNLPDDAALQQFVPALVRKLGLPDGEYALILQETGARLTASSTLAGVTFHDAPYRIS